MKIEINLKWLVGFAVVAALIVVLFFVLRGNSGDVGQAVPAKPAPEVKSQLRQPAKINAGKVSVYSGGNRLKQRLSLPEKVIKKESEQIIAASKVGASDYPHTVTTVIDLETGDSQTYMRRDPLPWLALSGRGSVGMYYGMRSGRQAVRVQAHQEFVRIKRLGVSAIGSVDVVPGASPDTFVGVGVAYRW